MFVTAMNWGNRSDRPQSQNRHMFLQLRTLLLRRSLPQLMRLLKLVRQLPRREILANVGQPLFYFPQGIFQILLVADRDVSPH